MFNHEKKGWRAAPGNEVDQCSLAQSTASFLADKIIDQPLFQSNIPLNRWYIVRIFQIWSTPVGYKELAERFEPIRNGEIF